MQLEKILHVEDDLDIQEITLFVLETLGGFTCEQRSSGNDAIEKAMDFVPDLIILDVMMPGMNGPDTLAELRKLPEFELIPVIFITAKAHTNEIQLLRDLGALDVFTKPFDPMTLVERINESWNSIHAGKPN